MWWSEFPTTLKCLPGDELTGVIPSRDSKEKNRSAMPKRSKRRPNAACVVCERGCRQDELTQMFERITCDDCATCHLCGCRLKDKHVILYETCYTCVCCEDVAVPTLTESEFQWPCYTWFDEHAAAYDKQATANDKQAMAYDKLDEIINSHVYLVCGPNDPTEQNYGVYQVHDCVGVVASTPLISLSADTLAGKSC